MIAKATEVFPYYVAFFTLFSYIYIYIVKASINISSKINRQEAKNQGFYDGRFRMKIVKDAKKELSRRWCRISTANA